jgi:outer membrane lipoprotein SlyB
MPLSRPRKHLCLALLGALPLLAGCAAPAPVRPVAQTSPLNGRLSTGTVVAVRPVNVAAGNAALARVLAGLGQPSASDPPPAEEVVIRRQDSSVVSVIEARQPGFTPGEDVNIAEAAATVLRPQ